MRNFCTILIISISILAAISPSFAKSEDLVLPSLDDPRLQKDADAVENDLRSNLNEDHRRTRLKEELGGLGQELQAQGEYQKALQAYDAALRMEKSSTNFLRRGYLLATMGNWPDAERDFRKSMDEWNGIAKEIVDFCLANGRPDIARHYEEPLRHQFTTPAMTRTLSKLCMQTGRAAEGRNLCRRAYYLDWVLGNDLGPSQELFKNINGSLYPKIEGMNKQSERSFWSTVDSLIAKGKFCTPAETRALLGKSSAIDGSQMRGSVKVDFSFLARNADAPIRSSSLVCDSDSKPHGVSLEPNILCCCLSKNDVTNYLKLRKLKIEGFEEEERLKAKSETRTELRLDNTEIPSEPPERVYDSPTDWGKLTFVFDRNGAGALKRVTIFFTEGGAALLPPLVILNSQSKNWQDQFEIAKDLLRERKFRSCRDELCETMVNWQLPSDHGRVQIPIEKKSEYNSIKDMFVKLYTKWGRPEIAQFIRETSLRQLVSECYAVIDKTHDDFPTATEFRHSMWRIQSRDQGSVISLELPGGRERNVTKDSPLYNELNKVLNGRVTAKIFPIEPDLLDRLEFVTAKNDSKHADPSSI